MVQKGMRGWNHEKRGGAVKKEEQEERGWRVYLLTKILSPEDGVSASTLNEWSKPKFAHLLARNIIIHTAFEFVAMATFFPCRLGAEISKQN